MALNQELLIPTSPVLLDNVQNLDRREENPAAISNGVPECVDLCCLGGEIALVVHLPATLYINCRLQYHTVLGAARGMMKILVEKKVKRRVTNLLKSLNNSYHLLPQR